MAKKLRTWTLQHQPIMTILQTVERLSSEFESVICIIRQCLEMSQTLHNRFLNAGLSERCRNLLVGFFLQRLLFFHATKTNLQFTNADGWFLLAPEGLSPKTSALQLAEARCQSGQHSENLIALSQGGLEPFNSHRQSLHASGRRSQLDLHFFERLVQHQLRMVHCHGKSVQNQNTSTPSSATTESE